MNTINTYSSSVTESGFLTTTTPVSQCDRECFSGIEKSSPLNTTKTNDSMLYPELRALALEENIVLEEKTRKDLTQHELSDDEETNSCCDIESEFDEISSDEYSQSDTDSNDSSVTMTEDTDLEDDEVCMNPPAKQ